VRLGVVVERLRAVTALEQERPALGDLAEALAQRVHLVRRHDRRHGRQGPRHLGDSCRIGPRGLLCGRQRPPCVQDVIHGHQPRCVPLPPGSEVTEIPESGTERDHAG
jgi:hypothetical protein